MHVQRLKDSRGIRQGAPASSSSEYPPSDLVWTIRHSSMTIAMTTQQFARTGLGGIVQIDTELSRDEHGGRVRASAG